MALLAARQCWAEDIDEHEVRVLVHQRQGVGVGARDLAPGLAEGHSQAESMCAWPPADDGVRAGGGRPGELAGQRCPAGRRGGADLGRVHRVEHVLEGVEHGGAPGVRRGRLLGDLPQHDGVVEQPPDSGIAEGRLHSPEPVLRVRGQCGGVAERGRLEGEIGVEVRVAGGLHEEDDPQRGRACPPRRPLVLRNTVEQEAEREVPVERRDALQRSAVGREGEALGLEADRAGGEAEVHDEVDQLGVGCPGGGDLPLHPQPGGRPGRAPDVAGRDRPIAGLGGGRERDRLAGRCPGARRQRSALGGHGWADPVADQAVQPAEDGGALGPDVVARAV